MANESYTLTNQKLYFAKQALAHWQTLENQAEQDIAKIKACQEITIFHLYSTLWALYNEVASYYYLPLLTTAIPISHILTADFVEKYPNPEMNQLILLLDDPSSGLAQLTKAWQGLFTPLSAKTVSANTIELQVIAIDPLTRHNMTHWLNELSALITHFRTGMAEY